MGIRPRPGDFVLVKTTDDCLIPVGSYGVVCGSFRPLNDCRPSSAVVTFGFYVPFRDKRGVIASGGPVRVISIRQLKNAHKYKMSTFWNYEGHLPSADSGKRFKKRVRVFEVCLSNMHITP